MSVSIRRISVGPATKTRARVQFADHGSDLAVYSDGSYRHTESKQERRAARKAAKRARRSS
jgi:hypothetical protein